jgi:hypothetical protein
VCTITLIYVKGKVLGLYAYAEETGLEWSREASREWAKAILAANPSDFKTSIMESLPFGVTGVTLAQVMADFTLVGIVFLIIGLVGWVTKRVAADAKRR